MGGREQGLKGLYHVLVALAQLCLDLQRVQGGVSMEGAMQQGMDRSKLARLQGGGAPPQHPP